MRFSVPEMSCGHCTAAIEKAVKAVDPAATVECDLESRVVSIGSALDAAAVRTAIREAGYESNAA